MKRHGHKPLQFLGCEIPPFLFRAHGFIAGKRVGGDDAVRYGFTNDDFQLHGQVDNRSRREAAIRPKVRIVILYEGEGQCRKRDIRQVVLFPHEPFHMVVGVPIASQTAFGPVYTHALREVLNKRAEVAQ